MDDGPLNTATLYGLSFAVSPKKALQCSFKQSLLQWSHLERSAGSACDRVLLGCEAESKDLPEWSENAEFKETLRSLSSSLRMTSPSRSQEDLLNVHQVATWQFARLGNLKERSRGLVGLPDEVPR